MDLITFENLKKEYGAVASWAIWADSTGGDTSDLSIFEDSSLSDSIKIMHTKFIFVALNISKPIDANRPFGNFHGGRRDFMLRNAIKDTPLEGAYMTDIIKFHPDLHSSSVTKYFKQNPDKLTGHFRFFLEEIKAVGALDDTTLVALGNDAFTLLQSTGTNLKILKLTHYSKPSLSAIDYKKEAHDLLMSKTV